MAKNKQPEHLEQIQVIQWARELAMAKILPGIEMLYAIPNGGLRHISVAVALKNEGVVKSIPDLHLPIARGGYNSLYIEMKVKGGTVDPGQKAKHVELRDHGNHVVVCWTHQEAKDTLMGYITGQIRR